MFILQQDNACFWHRQSTHKSCIWRWWFMLYNWTPKKSGLLVNYKISLHFAVGYLCLTIYIYIYIEQRALYIHNLLGNCRRMFLVLFSFFLQPAEWTQLIGFASLLVQEHDRVTWQIKQSCIDGLLIKFDSICEIPMQEVCRKYKSSVFFPNKDFIKIP